MCDVLCVVSAHAYVVRCVRVQTQDLSPVLLVGTHLDDERASSECCLCMRVRVFGVCAGCNRCAQTRGLLPCCSLGVGVHGVCVYVILYVLILIALDYPLN